MLSHNNLSNYYFLIHSLVVVENKYSVTEIEKMIPFERDVYVGLLQAKLEKENRDKAQQI